MNRLSSTAGSMAGWMVGATLAGVVRAFAALRPSDKPLHPKGVVRHARLLRRGVEPPTGVAFLDTVATDDVLVRESRSVGLPRALPDIQGLALRVPNPDGSYGDALFASNGFGWLTRFLLIPTRTTYGRPMTTLLPYDTAAGPVLLGVRAVDTGRLELGFAVGDGRWRTVGEIELSDRVSDEEITFDPIRNPLPGLGQYAAVRRLREPAYTAARSSRDED
jgi:hypothetical protein